MLSFVLFAAFILPQEIDSLLNQNIQTISDTNFVQIDDTTAVSDSILTITVKSDTIAPIQGIPLTDVSTIINKRTFLFDQYRYTGDILRSFSLNFVKDYGFIGYPNETFIYGVGNSGISYLQDGVFWNDRYTNSLDLNLVQSENIDSIEIVPSPRGFLYGPYNNPVTINFITKDFISPQPYSRIRYYEGPDGEAMIDGKFSAMLAKRWNYSFQLTNRSKDETYKNTELSLWQFNTKLKYLLSNSINFQAYYYYVDKEQGLNGGVDYDSLTRSSDDPNADLYDPIASPVFYPDQKLNILQHNVGLRTLAKPFENSQLDLSLYYRYGLDELRDVQDSLDYKLDKENKSYGAVLNYYYSYDFWTLQLLGDYEKLNNKIGENNSLDDERYNIGGLIAFHTLDNMIKLSLFFKTGHWERINEDYEGFGGDIKYSLNQTVVLYAGYSIREEIWASEQVPSFETGIQINYSSLWLDLKYASNEYYNYWYWYGGPEFYREELAEKIKSIGLTLNYKFWLFLLETNTSYYLKTKYDSSLENYVDETVNIPDWQFIGGLYVNDFFFNNNLDLKAGFKFYYTGEINSSVRWWWGSTVVEPTNKLDFNLAGEIQKVAIFYFQWENLFGNEYYITPYYPMPVRNIKFGIAWELFN
ncbi:MAG: TonB-dependent receptor plug domain-containing protein [Ignavibacteriaceae bacterium]|nr:TonB-dependent receptor plug domain-containing protein [Ignavibacteriaceae bacterium]